MTEQNKRKNVEEESERGSRALAAAELLNKNGFLSDAVSRLYYFLLYHVRALLLTKGIEPRTHESALRPFSLHFVKGGVSGPEASHLFSRTMKYREEADYNPSYLFTAADFSDLKQQCEALTIRIKGFLHENGYL